MKKTQVCLAKEELKPVREAAARSGRSMSEVIRQALRKTVLKPRRRGFVAIWDGKAKRSSLEHAVHEMVYRREVSRLQLP